LIVRFAKMALMKSRFGVEDGNAILSMSIVALESLQLFGIMR